MVDVSANESKENVLWYNLKQADSIHNLRLFIAISMAYFKQYPTKNYQDLEKELRQRRFDTHLIANETSVLEEGMSLVCPDHTSQAIYEIIYSCRPKEHALKEVLMHWKTYEENFEHLALSGIKCVITKLKNPDYYEFTDKQKEDNDELENCRKKIVVNMKKITKDDIVEDLKQEYGTTPELHIKTST